MKTIKYIFLLLLSFSLVQTKAQLTYGADQFLFNPVMVNPSLAGMHSNQIQLGYDARWVGINDAPKTGYISYDRMFNGNTGWNVAVVSDRIGPISSVALANAFAFMVQTNADAKLSFGLKHHLTQSYLRLNQNNLIDGGDPLLAVDQTGVPVNNFDASIAYINPNTFMVGFSYRNLINQPRFRFTNTMVEPIMSLQGWYARDFGDYSLESYALISTSKNTPLNANIGVMGVYRNEFGAGLNFSPNNQAGVFAYLKGSEKLNIFYNYNYPISDISKASKQSHSIGIAFRLGNETLSTTHFFLQPTDESFKTRLF